MVIQHFYDEETSTLTYVVHDERVGVVIDTVADFDPKSGWTRSASCERVAAYIDEQRLTIPYVLDTHAHADHLSGIPFFAERYGARSVIGWRITDVQAMFRDIFNLGPEFPVDGRQFDVLLRDGEVLHAGPLRIRAHYTPGHTPACMTYEIEDALFVGDVLFMPDYGTARCDFPGGSAGALYDSVQRLYALSPTLRVFTCHDYRPGGRPLRFVSTIGEERAANVQLNVSTSKAAFLRFREARDAELAMPTLILPSVQVNIRAGRLPAPEVNGVSYLKLPVNAFGPVVMSALVLGLAVVLSLAMGLSLGLLGGGGSILAVPILVYVLGVETKAAIASSLLVVGGTSAIGLVRHAHVGNVRWRTGVLFAGISMLGAYGGGRAAAHVPGIVLLLLLAAMMIATAIAMLRPAGAGRGAPQRRQAGTGEILLEALALGSFTGLIGAGGGFLIVPTLLLLGGLSMREAIGTSLLVIALNSLAGFAGHARHATVDWTLTALVASVAAVGAVGGGMLSTHLPQRVLRRAFACLVLGMGVFLVAGQLPAPLRSALVPWWPLWLVGVGTAMALLCRWTLRGPGTVEAR